MTDRLSTLLHDQASAVEVPTAPAAEILARGHGLQRRRRTTAVVAVAAATVLVAGVATAAVSARHDDNSIQPVSRTDQLAYQEKGAWAVGDDVHIGNHVVTVPGLDDLRYTSLGVLAWNQVPGADYASTSAKTVLISPDGEVHPVDLPGLDTYVLGPAATDPTTPYVAYTRSTGEPKQGEVVLADLATGETSVLGTPFTKRVPEATRMSFLGEDLVLDSATLVDRASGDRSRLRISGITTPDGYAGDHYVTSDLSGEWQVHSIDDDQALLTVRDTSGDTQGQGPSLSPDGRYFAVPTGASGIDVYTVATGDSVHLGGERDVSDYGWTPDGHLVGKPSSGTSQVETCDPTTGECTGLGATVTDDLTVVRGAEGIGL